MPTAVGNLNNQTAGLPISQLINNPNQTSVPKQTGSGSVMGKDQFLILLTTQLKNQDPTKPIDNTQMVAQLAQFSALEAQTNLQQAFASFQGDFAVMQSATLVGRTATVNTPNASGNSSSLTGKIAGIQILNGQPEFTMTDLNGNVIADSNGTPLLFKTSQITGIK